MSYCKETMLTPRPRRPPARPRGPPAAPVAEHDAPPKRSAAPWPWSLPPPCRCPTARQHRGLPCRRRARRGRRMTLRLSQSVDELPLFGQGAEDGGGRSETDVEKPGLSRLCSSWRLRCFSVAQLAAQILPRGLGQLSAEPRPPWAGGVTRGLALQRLAHLRLGQHRIG